jgi:phosphopantetheinyl transferase (holo-ACP synthase)
LPLVGNDLVDLTDEEAHPGQRHPRFDQRVFSARECAQIDASPDPNRSRWTLWAVKESAYKLAKKLSREARFIPLHFTSEVDERGTGSVYYRGHRFFSAAMQSAQWVHAIAIDVIPDSSLPNEPILHIVKCERHGYRIGLNRERQACAYAAIRPLSSLTQGADSREARTLVSETMAEILGVDARQLDVETRLGIPRLRLNCVELGADLSLSHHGRFVAFTCSVGGLGQPF